MADTIANTDQGDKGQDQQGKQEMLFTPFEGFAGASGEKVRLKEAIDLTHEKQV